ncbi:A disintegrin and metalloproteinase with thrombospondin motifs 2-like [Dunckerocampus dactyliophorus]|uniref:A disintegrin and metalloproteinase with thrombospondin motifs 2-like n=1 Tax=Dunckerocampus dactyliophorus TaxID=161453 RepID=UPI0024052C7C|nr:A disintegrin and metalloproteinase with thrombospondin motifs 2-like [Dunckerocampus dactyliophorus]
MDLLVCGVFIVFVHVTSLHSALITDNTDSLHQVLSEFSVIRPIRTNSLGHFLSASVSAQFVRRSKRQAHSSYSSSDTNKQQSDAGNASWMDTPQTGNQFGSSWKGRKAQLFYNVTVFGQELHLQLRPNWRLVAPHATMEWWEESGPKRSQPIGDTSCFYTGEVSNMEDTSVAISNCDGLAGMIRTGKEEFFIEPLYRWGTGSDGKEEDEEGGRQHIVYRTSAIINTKQHNVNQSDDFLPAPLLGSSGVLRSNFGSGRQRRYIEEAEMFNIEVLLAVDYSVLLFHGQEHVQRYLLTLMNIVNEIYQDHSLGANINVVLVRIIMLSPSKSQELISVGNAQKSLENVCGWSYLQQRDQNHDQQHDHLVYLSRREFGPSGMQGYAPVTGMCQLHQSCVLVFEDGFSSAFVAAHEIGHVLGMEHDGEANECDDDVLLGSIMSPRVQATFYRYHWSRCSWSELHKYLHTYDCLRDDPFSPDWPTAPLLPGFQYSMEQQCGFDFGPGYGTCSAYPNLEPCKQLWCSDYNNPFFCKSKKGPPLDGTPCGQGKHCFKGFCIKLTPDLLRQDGGWGQWSSYGSCSRTCGGGVRIRTRNCDSPPPANGGHTCFGNSYEFLLCNRDEQCPPLADFRGEQCQVWDEFLEHEGRKHHWLPIEHADPDERCRLFCQSNETGAVVSMKRTVHDGTQCSYNDAYSVCVRGECEHVGCDGLIASDQQEDRCGVCGGDNSSCRLIKGNFTRSANKTGYLKILEIPRGARHLLVQEFRRTPHVLALKNQETGHLFLNDEDAVPVSRVLVEKAVAWEYTHSEEQEVVQTTGPLKYAVVLMVRSHGDAKVTVSYKYIIQDHLRSSLESNLVQEDTIFYEWALKKWSQCSKTCGGGKQYTRFGCRRKADGKMVQRTFCSNINKPRAISRKCNAVACSLPRWVSGGWEACSASCGQSGWQRRWVGCQQESDEDRWRSVNSELCGDRRPDSKRPCNRFACPAAWRAGPWTPCSVTCGNGTQERQVACVKPEGSSDTCSMVPPITNRTCRAPPCGSDQKNFIVKWLSRSSADIPPMKTTSGLRCRGDRSVFCRMESLSRYCSNSAYRQMCCKSCSNFSGSGNVSMSTTVASRSSPSPTSGTTPATLTQTALPKSTDFVYVDYGDYDEYFSYEDAALVTSTPPDRKTAPPYFLVETTPTVAMVTIDAQTSLTPLMETSVAPHSETTQWATSADITVRGRSLKPNGTGVEHQTSAFLPKSPKKENNSMSEVSYGIVGLDSDTTRGQQSYFVPRKPPFRERTQNKRIQELLNEKLKRPGRRSGTEHKHSGL